MNPNNSDAPPSVGTSRRDVPVAERSVRRRQERGQPVRANSQLTREPSSPDPEHTHAQNEAQNGHHFDLTIALVCFIAAMLWSLTAGGWIRLSCRIVCTIRRLSKKPAASVSLSPRGTSGERAGERGAYLIRLPPNK